MILPDFAVKAKSSKIYKVFLCFFQSCEQKTTVSPPNAV